MQTFKRYSSAKKAANGKAILEIVSNGECLFVVFEQGYNEKLAMINLVSPKGENTGCITLRHLDRLGNANYAENTKSRLFMPYSFEH